MDRARDRRKTMNNSLQTQIADKQDFISPDPKKEDKEEKRLVATIKVRGNISGMKLC